MTEKVLLDEHRSTSQLEEDAVVDSESRVELLERNLRYIQQQHEITLADLHSEINRLQKENKDLQYQFINTHSSEQDSQYDRQPLVDDIKENQLKLESRIAELEKQLNNSEESNRYLLNKVTDLNRLLSSKSETPEIHDRQPSARTNDSEYQNIISSLQEKQQQYLQEITKLRTVSLEILNTERLSVASKVLLRDCLTSTNIIELSSDKATTTPIDMLFNDDKQTRRSNVSPSLLGRAASLRQLNNQQRVNLPNIPLRNGSTLSQPDASSLPYHSMSPTDYSQYHRMAKFGETPIARRERRTQELQRNRLMKHLYH